MVRLMQKNDQGVFFDQLLVARRHDMKNANNYYLVTIYTNMHLLIHKYLTCNKQCVIENTPQMHHSGACVWRQYNIFVKWFLQSLCRTQRGYWDQSGQLSRIAMAKSNSFLQEESYHPDQTNRMPRLIRVIDICMFLIYTNSAAPKQMT